MHLRDIIDRLSHDSPALCIVAKRPWSPDAAARLVHLTEDFRIPDEAVEQGYEYFLEVSVALEEVIGDLENVLSQEQRFNAVLFYAENDAYPDWLTKLRDQENA